MNLDLLLTERIRGWYRHPLAAARRTYSHLVFDPSTRDAEDIAIQDTLLVGSSLLDDRNGRVGNLDPGCWLLLRDAVRQIGSLEHLYRLAMDGGLQSREDADGRIEVWVTQRDRFADSPTRPPDTASTANTAVASTTTDFGGGSQLTTLIASITQMCERQIELARENGALGERVPSLESEVQRLRESSGSDRHALDELRKQLEALTVANTGLTAMLSARTEGQVQRYDHVLWLVVGISVILCVMAGVLWAVGWLPFHIP